MNDPCCTARRLPGPGLCRLLWESDYLYKHTRRKLEIEITGRARGVERVEGMNEPRLVQNVV
jgi:hypothetical protein